VARPYVAFGAVLAAGAMGAFGLVPFHGVGANSKSVPTPLPTSPTAAPLPASPASLHVQLALAEGVDASIPGSAAPATAAASWDGDTLRVTIANVDPVRFPAGCPVSMSVKGFKTRTVTLTPSPAGTMASTQFAATKQPTGKASIDMTCPATGAKGGTVFADYEGSLG